MIIYNNKKDDSVMIESDLALNEKELSEYQKYILSQMVNSDKKTIEEIGLEYQKQLAEIFQQQNFYLNR